MKTATEVTSPPDLFRRLEDELNTSFQRTFNSFFPSYGKWIPRADMWENHNHMFITLDTPGVEKENLSLSTTPDRTLLIQGHREETITSELGARILFQETRKGEFSRMFKLPETVKPDNIKAYYNNGTLTIQIQKETEELAQGYGEAIPISIENPPTGTGKTSGLTLVQEEKQEKEMAPTG